MRRSFVRQLIPGRLTLDPAEAHHLRDVLRLGVGERIELFDPTGARATGEIVVAEAEGVQVQIDAVMTSPVGRLNLEIVSAVPKADRADWLVEKLTEIGVARWTPLRTARSVVHPEGVAKYERWRRLAIEAAKQSRRGGVMEIVELISLEARLAGASSGPGGGERRERAFVLSTRPGSIPFVQALSAANKQLAANEPLAANEQPSARELRSAREDAFGANVTLYVGPEGGWTDGELAALTAAGAIEVSLGATILRIETATVVGAGIAFAMAMDVGATDEARASDR